MSHPVKHEELKVNLDEGLESPKSKSPQRTHPRWFSSVMILTALVLMGNIHFVCDRDYQNVTTELTFQIPAGQTEEVARVQLPREVLSDPGKLSFSGKFTPLVSNSSAPPNLLILVQHVRSGNILEMRSFALTVKSNGAIPFRAFPFPMLHALSNDQLVIAIQPVGGALGPGKLRFQWRYRAS